MKCYLGDLFCTICYPYAQNTSKFSTNHRKWCYTWTDANYNSNPCSSIIRKKSISGEGDVGKTNPTCPSLFGSMDLKERNANVFWYVDAMFLFIYFIFNVFEHHIHLKWNKFRDPRVVLHMHDWPFLVITAPVVYFQSIFFRYGNWEGSYLGILEQNSHTRSEMKLMLQGVSQKCPCVGWRVGDFNGNKRNYAIE